MYRDYKDRSFGPMIEKVPILEDFIDISNQAHKRCALLSDTHPAITDHPASRIINPLMFHADGTSYSVRALSCLGQTLEAFALLRIRLEQFIVCSYLLHAEVEDGLLPFAQDIRRGGVRLLRFIRKDKEFYKVFESILGGKIDEIEREVKEREEKINPDFDYENDRLPKGWTQLSTHDLALHRDKKIPDSSSITQIKLKRLYDTLYRSSSIFVHSGSATIGNNFLTTLEVSGLKMLGPQQAYLLTNVMQCAQIDTIQCFEVLQFFGLDEAEFYSDLQDEYIELLSKELEFCE